MNIEKVVKLIRVEKPVKFKIRAKVSNKFVGLHIPIYHGNKLKEHQIIINAGNLVYTGERDIETLIVHELIHCWQTERGYLDAHGKSFKRKVKQVSGKLGMPRLYLKTVDD